jgi:rod shape-determining protein MreC
MLPFVRRHQVLLASLLCVLLSLYILALAGKGRLKGDPIGPLLLTLMRPFQIAARAVLIQVGEIEETSGRLLRVAAENEALRERIEELEAERHRLLEAEATNQKLRELLDLRSTFKQEVVAAHVIGHSASGWFYTLLLDKGGVDGVEKGMAAITPLGAVGQVVSVNSRSAKVLLIADPRSGVDVIDQRSRARGILSGSLESGPIMKYVKRSEDVLPGDSLITSGLDGIFPKGLNVGTVTDVKKAHFGLFQHVEVALTVDPSQTETVLLLRGSPERARN